MHILQSSRSLKITLFISILIERDINIFLKGNYQLVPELIDKQSIEIRQFLKSYEFTSNKSYFSSSLYLIHQVLIVGYQLNFVAAYL